MKRWKVDTGECVGTCEGHWLKTTSLAWDALGKWFFSASQDGRVRIWAVGRGSCARAVEGGGRPLLCVGDSEDGRYLLTGGEDQTVKLWFLDWELEEPKEDSAPVPQAPRPRFGGEGSFPNSLSARRQ